MPLRFCHLLYWAALSLVSKHVVLNILVYDKHGEEIGNYDIEFKTKYDSTTDTYDIHNTTLDERKKNRQGKRWQLIADRWEYQSCLPNTG